MLIRPTQEQIDYLTKTVGVDPDTLGGLASGPSRPDDTEPDPAFTPVVEPGWFGRSLRPIILGIILALMLLLRIARGEAMPFMAGETAMEPNNSETLLFPAYAVPTSHTGCPVGSHGGAGDFGGGNSSASAPFSWLLPVFAAMTTIAVAGWGVTYRRLKRLETACPMSPVVPVVMPRILPVRPPAPPLVAPREQMDLIIQTAAEFPHIRLKPRHPEGPWSLALATARGNVRLENQDYGLCFRIGECDALVIADGCGGLPHGRRGAYLAATAAAAALIRRLGTARRFHRIDIVAAAEESIQAAAHRLAVEGDKANLSEIRDGLRTTLIALVRDPREIGCAYIGDGGAYVLRASGEVESLLTPQKAEGHALNVLAASLGPRMEGDPVTGRLVRMPGDLVVAGTDGIFDRVNADFARDVFHAAKFHEGDLQKTAEAVLEELVRHQDAIGYVCDDNVTLGIMGDGGNLSVPSPGRSQENAAQGNHSQVRLTQEHPRG